MKTNLKSNPEFDNQYYKIRIILENTSTPKKFDFIYDVAKRLINTYGIGVSFIEKIYVLGYINGKQSERKIRKQKQIATTSNMEKGTKLLHHVRRKLEYSNIKVFRKQLDFKTVTFPGFFFVISNLI